MKVKNLVLMALVATMGLVSCSKDEHEGGVKTDTMPKSVTIKLPNIQKTVKSRATGDAMKGGSQVALENFKVFFVDAAGNLQTVPQYENQDQQVYFSKTDSEWAEIGENGKDITYHFLPAATSKVVVVGISVTWSTLQLQPVLIIYRMTMEAVTRPILFMVKMSLKKKNLTGAKFMTMFTRRT